MGKAPIVTAIEVHEFQYNPPVHKDGCVSVPEGPGLGVEYDWDFIMKNRTAGVEYN